MLGGRVPNPMIAGIEFDRGRTQFLQISISTKHIIQVSLTSSIFISNVRNGKEINISIYVNKRGLESKRDIKNPRIPKKRSKIRVDRINMTKRFDVRNNFIKTSKKPRAIHRS